MRNKKKLPLITEIRIEKAVSGGKCLLRYNDTVIFVEEGVVPDDVVDLQIIKKKKTYWIGQVVRFHSYSKLREKPFCAHFGICGGCKWQHLPYTEQLKYKEQETTDALTRIGKVALPSIKPILASAKTQYYRNKLEFTFSNSRWLTAEEIATKEKFEAKVLGFHVPKRFDKIIDIEHCYLQPEPSNAIRLAVKSYALEHNLTFFDLRKQENFLRNLIIRTASTGDVMVVMCFYYEDKENILGLMNFLKDKFPEITSLQYVVNTKQNDTIGDLEIQLFAGKPYITEEMEGLFFRVGAKSFYQTNPTQAYELYKIAREMADLQGDEIVYDLYTGTGTIANFVAKKAKKVIGLEYVADAIEDAKINSNINKITNTVFYAGDMKDLLTPALILQEGTPDVIITDPPRAGMHEDVIKVILQANPKSIIYVSCNPATQARDVALLSDNYEVVAVQAVDMFPHTYHVESVVKLVRKEIKQEAENKGLENN